jgi:proline iminopeptidase
MKKPLKKVLILSSTVLILLILVGGWWFFQQMSQPLYTPGTLKGSAISVPPQQGDTSFWNMPGGVRLFHFAEGQGANILTLHGGPGIPWEKPVPGLSALADQYRVHYYDQRGCGRSSRPFDRFASSNYYRNMKTLEATLGIRAQLEDIERIRQLLGEEKLILIGHSFGGFIAALYAAEYPEKVKALILVAPADLLKMPPENGDLFETVRKDLPAAMQAEFDQWQKDYFDFSGIFKKSESDLQGLNRQFSTYYGAVVKARGLTMPEMSAPPEFVGGWGTHAMYFSMGQKHDYRAYMSAVKAPVLIIHGTNDLQPEASDKAFAATFSNVTYKTINETGHFPFYEKPAEFAEIIRLFLAEKAVK